MKVDSAIKFVLFSIKLHLVSSFLLLYGFLVKLIIPLSWEEALNTIDGVALNHIQLTVMVDGAEDAMIKTNELKDKKCKYRPILIVKIFLDQLIVTYTAI